MKVMKDILRTGSVLTRLIAAAMLMFFVFCWSINTFSRIFIYVVNNQTHMRGSSRSNQLCFELVHKIRSSQYKKAIRITFGFACDMPYSSTLFVARIPVLAKCRDSFLCDFFKSVLQPSSCLYNLLPPPRDTEWISRLRARSKFPRIPIQTKKYQSFMSFAIAHYQ